MLRRIGYSNVQFRENSELTQLEAENDRPDLIIANASKGNSRAGQTFAEAYASRQIPVILLGEDRGGDNVPPESSPLPIAYLKRPFGPSCLRAAIERSLLHRGQPDYIGYIIQRWQQQQLIKECIFVRQEGILVKIRVRSIDRVEADGNYSYIHLAQKTYTVKTSLKSIRQALFPGPFLQINRGCVINFNTIKTVAFSESYISTTSGNYPVGNAYRKEVESWLNRP